MSNNKNSTKDITPYKEIKQHNELIEACYSMNKYEKFLLALGFSLVHDNDYSDLNNRIVFNITHDLFKKNFPESKNKRDFVDNVKSLRNRKVYIRSKSGEVTDYNWFDSITISSDEKTINLSVSSAIQTRLIDLAAGSFSYFKLMHISKLSSIYAIRLYEMLIQWRKTRILCMTVDQARFRFDCLTKYKDNKKFLQNVVSKSIDQINSNETCNIKITNPDDYIIRDGRAIKSFKIIYEFKTKPEDNDPNNKKIKDIKQPSFLDKHFNDDWHSDL